MEQENKKKRARDEQSDVEIKTASTSSSNKKQNNLNYNDGEDEDYNDVMFRKMEPGDDVKVFDFPWLKEGMISKSDDEWKFEDSFSFLLDDDYCSNNITAGALDMPLPEHAHCNLQFACQGPTHVNMSDDHKSSEEDDTVENVDGIWSSLINQPLSAGFINDRGV